MDGMGKYNVFDQHVVELDYYPEIHNKFFATIFIDRGDGIDKSLAGCPHPINLVLLVSWKRCVTSAATLQTRTIMANPRRLEVDAVRMI